MTLLGPSNDFRPDLAGSVVDRAAAIDPRYRDVDGARRASRRRRTDGGNPEGVDSFRAGPWSERLDRCETACRAWGIGSTWLGSASSVS